MESINILILRHYLMHKLSWLFTLFLFAALLEANPNSRCQKESENITVPYKFGIRKGSCSMGEFWFDINCSTYSYSPPKSFSGKSNLENDKVVQLSSNLKVRVDNSVAYSCNTKSSGSLIWDAANKFTVKGSTCDSFGFLGGTNKLASECVSLCNINSTFTDEPCPGIGCCCYSSIPKGINLISFVTDEAESIANRNSKRWNLTFAAMFFWFVSMSGAGAPFCRLFFPMLMVGNISSAQPDALTKLTQFYKRYAVPHKSYKQSRHALTIDTPTKMEYQLKNNRGYIPHKVLPTKLTLGLGFCCSFILFGISGVYFSVKKKKFIKLKSKFFQKNGGLLLEQHIANSNGIGSTKIFTAEELEIGADYYKKSHTFGVEESQMECFINEIVTLTQINHQNVVKFLGCCLETEAPILVYELASKGTLFNYIHYTNGQRSLPWDILLKIASESAAALAYLHSSAEDSSKPLIIHGNVNSSNILLSDGLEAKVCGFGPSRLIPVNESQISTLVQRTVGYLDPEYLRTGQLTDKSDVYSFGVVLLELLTGEKPISFDRPEGQRIITSHFVLSMEQNDLFQIVAQQLVINEGNREQVRAVAELAKRCLKLSGAERPTMEQVAGELKRLSETYPEVQVGSHEHTERFIRAQSSVGPK